jgi:hypothetical protein
LCLSSSIVHYFATGISSLFHIPGFNTIVVTGTRTFSCSSASGISFYLLKEEEVLMPHRQRDEGEGSQWREGRHNNKYIRCVKGGDGCATTATAAACRCCFPPQQQQQMHHSSKVESSLPGFLAVSPDDTIIISSCEGKDRTSSDTTTTTTTTSAFPTLHDENKRLTISSSPNPVVDIQQLRNMNAFSNEDGLGVIKEILEHTKQPYHDNDMLPALMRTWNFSTLTSCSSFYQRNRIRRLPQQRRIEHHHHQAGPILVLFRSMTLGALLGGLVVLSFFSLWNLTNPCSFQQFSNRMQFVLPRTLQPLHQQNNNQIRKGHDPTQLYSSSGIMSYLNMYQSKLAHPPSNQTITDQEMRERRLASSTSSSVGSSNSVLNDDYKDTQLVIAGKMSVEDAPCNIAQYNFKKNKWSLTERIQLSLYNSYSGGEVYSLLANHTSTRHADDTTRDEEGESKK